MRRGRGLEMYCIVTLEELVQEYPSYYEYHRSNQTTSNERLTVSERTACKGVVCQMIPLGTFVLRSGF